MLYRQTTLNCKGRLIDLSEPIVMGILNVTPDSFYDGGRYNDITTILKYVERMLTEGVTIIDVGGMSTRPGATLIEESLELTRVVPVIEAITRYFPDAVISVDTVRASVARQSVEAGASIINDISGGDMDDKMFETVAALSVPYILMHIKGTPQTMQQSAYYEDVTLEVLDYLIKKIGQLRGLKVKDIIVDPGFGFGKTIDHNFELLKKLHVLKILDVPILAGLSRKSMIWKTLRVTPDEALNGTTVLNLIALQQGAQILRVHDVKEAVETICLFKKMEMG